MPRAAREKQCNAIYHIMCRSVTEILLFRDDLDKDQYLGFVKKYTDTYKCSVYAYCLMNNHLHMHLDPKGYDISKLMHSINTAYVIYYNKKYERHGHLFQERFQSRILDSESYNLAVSAYIHNNPKDIPGFRGKEEEYGYSSFGIYLGLRKDVYKLIDTSLLYGIFGVNGRRKFSEKYLEFVNRRRENGSLDELMGNQIVITKNEYITGRKTLIREVSPEKVIAYILHKLKLPVASNIMAKNQPKASEYRAFTAYVLRVLCGLGYKQICEYIYNITISGCSRLCFKGYELSNDRGLIYSGVFSNLINNFGN